MQRVALVQDLDVGQRGLAGPRHALQGARRKRRRFSGHAFPAFRALINHRVAQERVPALLS
jgi:hypothetical protein